MNKPFNFFFGKPVRNMFSSPYNKNLEQFHLSCNRYTFMDVELNRLRNKNFHLFVNSESAIRDIQWTELNNYGYVFRLFVSNWWIRVCSMLSKKVFISNVTWTISRISQQFVSGNLLDWNRVIKDMEFWRC